MTKRRASLLALAMLALGGLAVLIPGSPVHFPDLFNPKGQYQGHSARHWVKALDSPDAEARYRAIFALGAIGADAGEAVPALAAILAEDPDRQARNQAALALSKMAPASRGAVPALAQALADKEPLVRLNAALALSRLREDARPAVPALIQALGDQDNRTRLQTFTFTVQEAVALALGRASAGTAAAVPALATALEAAVTEETRVAVVRALGEIGAEARLAVPQLRALLKDKSKRVREATEESLGKIEPAPARG